MNAIYEPTADEIERMRPYVEQHCRVQQACGHEVSVRWAQIVASMMLQDRFLQDRLQYGVPGTPLDILDSYA